MPDRAGLTGTDLRLSYGGMNAVDGASLNLTPGRVTALIGPNGSGKSTLLRAMAQLHQPTDGSVSFPDGTRAEHLHPKEFARHVALLAQSRPSPGGIRVVDLIAYGRHPYRGRFRNGDADGADYIARAMDICGVTHMAQRSVDALSGGEKQRVWFAMALAQNTDTLLLDEPTNHLDLRYQVESLDLIRDLAELHTVAIGVVLHDLNQAAAVADAIVLLSQGKVVATGPAEEVLTSENLSSVYGIPIDVSDDPATGCLNCQPRGRHYGRRTSAVATA
ncbi:ABC transporter ATP-binding protein [Haloglycomyces albus]|uniref:ABC transporter ATP-binding protein n=1 Tax=Haloglycomyces albus TaxID=526067 RepID=UPI00046D1063|nr:ABC transporter ATP-binding protein [Haloglycomyces albus]